jgi:hypothetical protein
VQNPFAPRAGSFPPELAGRDGLLTEVSVARGPLRSKLIAKGMIYSPAHGDNAFTVPLFESFLKVGERVKRELGPLSEKYMATRIKRTDDYLVRELAPMLDVPELGMAYGLQDRDLELFHLNDVAILIANPALVRRMAETIPA